MRYLAAAVLPLLFVSSGRAADLPGILAKIDTAAASFQGLIADVKQVSHLNIMPNDDETSIGTIVVKRPRPKALRALLEFKPPNQYAAAFDGKTAQRYLPKLNLIEIYDVDKKFGGLVDQYLLLGFGASSAELKQVYDIAYVGAETVAGKKATKLALTPKKPDKALHLTKAEIWYADDLGIAVQQKLFTGTEGDYLLATYTNIKLNPQIPDSDVTLKAPKDAKKEYPLK
jgi:outer membrane lipoprotein-sorting protein